MYVSILGRRTEIICNTNKMLYVHCTMHILLYDMSKREEIDTFARTHSFAGSTIVLGILLVSPNPVSLSLSHTLHA